MTGGAPYLTPADAARISKKNVPPPAEQPPQLRYSLPPAKPMTSSPHPAHAIVNKVLKAANSPAHMGAGQQKGGGAGSGAGTNSLSGIMGMLTALLGRTATGALISPDNTANSLIAPDNAQSAAIQSALDGLPDAKAQALANIANWYGQVGSSEKTAASKDNTMATDLSKAMADNAQGIASGLGGAAMPGSAQISAIGANDANTMKSIGASDASLADELAPIFALSKAGASSMMSGKYDSAKTDLLNQLATSKGNAQADYAKALMDITNTNNQTRQNIYGNQADLLKTLASLQIGGVNAATKAQSTAVLNALRAAEAKKAATQAGNGYGVATSQQKAKVAQDITNALVDTNTGKLKSGLDWPTALRDARNIVRTNGWDPLNPGVVSGIIGPALGMAGVSFQNPNTLYQP